MTDRKNIKVNEDEWKELKAEKPDGASWGYYLTEIRTIEESEP